MRGNNECSPQGGVAVVVVSGGAGGGGNEGVPSGILGLLNCVRAYVRACVRANVHANPLAVPSFTLQLT